MRVRLADDREIWFHGSADHCSRSLRPGRVAPPD